MGPVLRARISRAMVGAALVLPVPLVGGEWPDPSVIFTPGGGYTAVTTSNGWAPTFRILQSNDLSNWRITGSVFRRPPRWAKTDFWAPEITKLRDRYAIFYSALPRRRGRNWYCLGVATAPAANGPYRDRGSPLRCNRYGSIDPFPVRDENGVLHLVWKEDGNEFRRPTPLFAQQLSEDGMQLAGPTRELLRNTEEWEGSVLEAPAVIRRNDTFYLFYSANLCCTKRCVYAVGVARSKTLIGPWEKYSGNPILRSGNGWKCPGHAAVVPNGAGGYNAFFHAYRAGNGFLAGRQLLGDAVSFGADGWPRYRRRGASAAPRGRGVHRLHRLVPRPPAGVALGVAERPGAAHPHRKRRADDRRGERRRTRGRGRDRTPRADLALYGQCGGGPQVAARQRTRGARELPQRLLPHRGQRLPGHRRGGRA